MESAHPKTPLDIENADGMSCKVKYDVFGFDNLTEESQ